MKKRDEKQFPHNINFNTFRTFRKLIKHEAKDSSHHFRFHLSLSVKIPVDADRVHQTSLFLVLANDNFSTDKGIHQKNFGK